MTSPDTSSPQNFAPRHKGTNHTSSQCGQLSPPQQESRHPYLDLTNSMITQPAIPWAWSLHNNLCAVFCWRPFKSLNKLHQLLTIVLINRLLKLWKIAALINNSPVQIISLQLLFKLTCRRVDISIGELTNQWAGWSSNYLIPYTNVIEKVKAEDAQPFLSCLV